MEVYCQLHTLVAVPLGKEPLVLVGGWVGPRDGLDAM
jgi:hypothetical protein